MAANEYAVEMIILLEDIDHTLLVPPVTMADIPTDKITVPDYEGLGQANNENEKISVYNSLLLAQRQKVRTLVHAARQKDSSLSLYQYKFTNMSYKQEDMLLRSELLGYEKHHKQCPTDGIITPADGGCTESLGWPFSEYMKDRIEVNKQDELAFTALVNAGKGYGFYEVKPNYFNAPDFQQSIHALEPGRGYFCQDNLNLRYIIRKIDGTLLEDTLPLQNANVDEKTCIQAILAQHPELKNTSPFTLNDREQALLNQASRVDNTKAIMFKKTLFELLYSAAQKLHPEQKLPRDLSIEALIENLNAAHAEGKKVHIQFFFVDDADKNINAVRLMFEYYKQSCQFDFTLETTWLDHMPNNLDDKGATVRERSSKAYSSIISDLTLRQNGPFASGEMMEQTRRRLLDSPVERAEKRKLFTSTTRKLKDGFIQLCEMGDAEALFVLAQLAARSGPAYHDILNRCWTKPGVVNIQGIPQDLISAYCLAKIALLHTEDENLQTKIYSFISQITTPEMLYDVHRGKPSLYTFMTINALRPDELYDIEIAKRKHPLKGAMPLSHFFASASRASPPSSNSGSANSYSSASPSSSVSNSPSATSMATLPPREKEGERPYSPRVIQDPFLKIIEIPVAGSTSELESPQGAKGHLPGRRLPSSTQ